MARARGANAIMAAAFETTYGTPPASGYRQLPFVSSNLGEEQGLIQDDVLGYGREPLAPSLDVANNDGDVVVPVDLRNFGNWLRLLLGSPVTTDSGADHSHVFTTGAIALPSMAIEVGFPEVPSYGMNFGVRANTMRIGLARSGLLNATFGLIAQGETKAGTTGAGTPAATVMQRFSQFQGGVSRNGTQLGNLVSADLTISNNLDKVEVVRPDGRIADADPGKVAVTGSVTLRFADTAFLDQASAGLPCALSVGWAIDAHRALTIAVPVVYLPKAKTPVTGPAGIQATFSWQAARDPNAGHAATVTLVNDVTAY